MPPSNQSSIITTVAKLASQLELEFTGDGAQEINSVATFSKAKNSDLCFLRSEQYIDQLSASECGAVIVPLNFKQKIAKKAQLYSANPHLSFVQAIDLLQLTHGNLGPFPAFGLPQGSCGKQ